MIAKFNIQSGQTFTVENANDWRFGRKYKVVGFDCDKNGLVYAVCEWTQEKGYKSSHIFYAEDFA